MCACSPRSSSPAASQASTARGTSSIGKPNFESTCPVWMYEWVLGLMPGVTRSSTRWERPRRRSISSKESTTMWPTPLSIA